MRRRGWPRIVRAMDRTTERLFTPAFIALTLSELAYFTAGGLIIGVTPFFVTGPVGSDEAGLGLVFAAFSVTTLILRPYAGRLADRHGRRPLLIGGALLCAAVILAHVPSADLHELIALRLALGVAEAFYFVAGIAALADLAPPGRAGEALSYNSLALYLGIAIGPLLGQGLIELGGFAWAWLGGFGLALVAGALAMRIPETAPRLGVAAPTPLLHRAAIGPGLALFAGVAAMTGFFALGGPHGARLGLEAWSVVFLVFGGVVVVSRIAFARLPDRLPPMRVVAMALLACAAGTTVVAAASGVATLLVGAAILAVGVALLTPAVFAAIFGMVSPGERGAAAGTASAFIDLAFGGSPLLLGTVAAVSGVPAAFGVGAAIALAGAIGALLGPRLRLRAAAAA